MMTYIAENNWYINRKNTSSDRPSDGQSWIAQIGGNRNVCQRRGCNSTKSLNGCHVMFCHRSECRHTQHDHRTYMVVMCDKCNKITDCFQLKQNAVVTYRGDLQ